MRRWIGIGLLWVVMVSVAATAWAEKDKKNKKAQGEQVPTVEALIDQGRAAYLAGRPREAVELLQKAIGLIQESREKGLAAFLPAVPQGWVGQEPESVSGTWGSGEQAFHWTQVSREYHKGGSGPRATVTITNSPQLIQSQRAMQQMMANPQYLAMMNSDPSRKMQPISVEGWSGWTTVDPNSAQAVALGENLMVIVDIDANDEAALQQLWTSLDLKGLTSQD